MENIDKKRYLTVREAAQKLGLADATVRFHVKERHLSRRKIGKGVFILESDVEKFVPRRPGRPKN